MKISHRIGIIAAVAAVAGLFAYAGRSHLAVLMPQGQIAAQQKSLMITVVLLMLIVVIPVFFLTFYIAWKYREDNPAATYEPNWTNTKLELIWWGVPFAIISILGVIIWQTSHSLDPYKTIASNQREMTIQVVALDWKWLFIYPDQNIATVNYVRIPQGVPVNFQITADAPMNSFWIPQLGGQVYAMPGMSTSLHLIADHAGTFDGSSVNISGRGYAGMKFKVDATSQADFDSWVSLAQSSHEILSRGRYLGLAAPTENNPVEVYSSPEPDLYNKIIMKYMAPISDSPEAHE